MSRELDELVLLFTSLNTEYQGALQHSTSEPNPRSLVCRENLPPPVHFERRRQHRLAPTASSNDADASIEAPPSGTTLVTNIRENGVSSDISFVLSLLLNDQLERPEDTTINFLHSLNELE